MAAKALESLRDYHTEQAAMYARVAENEHRMSPDWAVAEAPEKRLFHLAAAYSIDRALDVMSGEAVMQPDSVDMAHMMAVLSTNYLQEHAPEKLRKDPTGEIVAGRLMLAHVYAWMRAPGSFFPHGFTPVADAMKAFLATLPRGMRQWRHKKRGTTYAEIGTLIVQAAQPVNDGEPLLVYIGEKGDLYGRPPVEFADGRFEAVS